MSPNQSMLVAAVRLGIYDARGVSSKIKLKLQYFKYSKIIVMLLL